MTPAQSTALLAIASPFVGAIAGIVMNRSRTAAFATAGAGGALVAAFALIAINIAGGPVEAIIHSADGRPLVGISIDPMASILLLLIAGVTTVVQSFSSRYLLGDTRAPRFALLCGATASALMFAASSVTLTGLAAGWCLAGVLACMLLDHSSSLQEARSGVRLTARTFMVGDTALIAATGLVLATGHDIDLRDPVAAAIDLGARQITIPLGGATSVGVVVALLVGICAVARSAQYPLHRWLPSTLAAPTPASAMLHAGLVNGAGLLLITLAPIVALAPTVLWALLGLGLVTAVLGTALSMVRTDVKGSLAWSTTGQMGFMVAQCSTGSLVCALMHMAGHGAYKASLFLGSGSAIDRQKRQRTEGAGQPALHAPARALVSLALPAILLAIATMLLHPGLTETRGSEVLLAFAWVSATQATWAWLSTTGGLKITSHIFGASVLGVAAFGYIAILSLLDAYVADSLPQVNAAWPPAWLTIAAIAGAAALAAALNHFAASSQRLAAARLSLWSAAQQAADTSVVARPTALAPPPELTYPTTAVNPPVRIGDTR